MQIFLMFFARVLAYVKKKQYFCGRFVRFCAENVTKTQNNVIY